MKVVFADDFWWDQVDGYAHVFRLVHRGVQVEVLDVAASHFRIGGGEYTVDEAFCGGDVGSGGAGVAGVVDEITPNGESCLFHFLFHWA